MPIQVTKIRYLSVDHFPLSNETIKWVGVTELFLHSPSLLPGPSHLCFSVEHNDSECITATPASLLLLLHRGTLAFENVWRRDIAASIFNPTLI